MRAALLALAWVLVVVPAEAQNQPRRPQTPTQQSVPKEPPKPVLPVEYEKPLLELSETIGSLAFLSGLCVPNAGPNPWQRRMEALVDSEGAANQNSERLIGAYNQGFSAYSTTYRQCTDAARTARSVLVREAARLAREIERRYGS
ncbi:COG5451 Predicted secreted protein [Rhabdaerophilaceae bacterium]